MIKWRISGGVRHNNSNAEMSYKTSYEADTWQEAEALARDEYYEDFKKIVDNNVGYIFIDYVITYDEDKECMYDFPRRRQIYQERKHEIR